MKSRVKWVENALFVGTTESGHAVVMDGPPEGGGQNLGIRPMEMILLGLGGCSAYDVMSILQKARQPVVDCEVLLDAERAEQIPKVFTRIEMVFKVVGYAGLSETHVQRAVQLSAEKYCSASIMLGESVEIIHRYEMQILDNAVLGDAQ